MPAPERASMNNFNYKNLTPLASRYTWDLQEHALQLEDLVQEQLEQIMDLERTIGRSGSASYQRDAEKWGAEWQQLNIDFGTYKLQTIEQIGQLQQEIRRLEQERDWLQEQNSMLESQIVRYEQIAATGGRPEQGREPNGRYAGSQWEQWLRAWDLHLEGLNVLQIADKMGLAPSTVDTYLRKYAKMYGLDIKPTASKDRSSYTVPRTEQ